MVAAAGERGKKTAWATGHSGVLGNELADLRAKKRAWESTVEGKKTITTARHEFRVTWKSFTSRICFFVFYILVTHMWPQHEGHDEYTNGTEMQKSIYYGLLVRKRARRVYSLY